MKTKQLLHFKVIPLPTWFIKMKIHKLLSFIPELGIAPTGNVIHQDEDQPATPFHTIIGSCQHNSSRWRPSSNSISTRTGHVQHNSSRWRPSSNSISTRTGHVQHNSSRWRSINYLLLSFIPELGIANRQCNSSRWRPNSYCISYQNWALPT